MGNLRFKISEAESIKAEDGADELMNSPNMRPYIELMMAFMGGEDTNSHLEYIRNLPLEKRYIWRIASALKWGFADFDEVSVSVDRQTLSPDDLAEVKALVQLRHIQFCFFLKELVGTKEMERLMTEGVAAAKQG